MNEKYLVRLSDEDRFWSDEGSGFVSKEAGLELTEFSLEMAKKFAIEWGLECHRPFYICDSFGNYIEKYSTEVENEIIRRLD